MVLAVNPNTYLARLDASQTVTGAEAETPPTTTTTVPSNGTVAYVMQDNSKEQFYLILFLALALILVFLYIMEKDKMMYRQQNTLGG